MALNSYTVNLHSENFYWFTSSGPNGNIFKGVILSPADLPAIENTYNLGLADYINGEWTDKNITDNKDLSTVMETVAAVILDYTEKFPDRNIYVRGNIEAKQRLYQRYASNNLEIIQQWFNVYGKEHSSEEFEPFIKGKKYEALLVERK